MKYLLGIAFLLLSIASQAQKKLPDFKVIKTPNKRVLVSWSHNYPDVRQITIQRSTDSLKNYKSIAVMPDPSLVENGYNDNTAPHDSMFYRIYILLDKGVFLFTKPQRPILDTSVSIVPEKEIKEKPVTPTGFVASNYIFTAPDKYISVSLPSDHKKYDIKFYTEAGQLLFELTDVKERKFKMDRTYFYKAGYYHFEIFADNKLFEKHKVYIPRDF